MVVDGLFLNWVLCGWSLTPFRRFTIMGGVWGETPTGRPLGRLKTGTLKGAAF